MFNNWFFERKIKTKKKLSESVFAMVDGVTASRMANCMLPSGLAKAELPTGAEPPSTM